MDGAGAGERLDRWLANRVPGQSRARLQVLIESGHVRVDGARSRPAARVRLGQRVTLTLPEPESAQPEPEDLPLRIVHDSPGFLVVDKPAGLAVHPGAGRGSGTLVNALLHHVRDLSGVGGVLRPGIVHRLDRGTSGLLVVAKDDESHRALARQFAARTVDKEYRAVVLGVPARTEGVIATPIGRDPVHRKKMSVRSRTGREARTSYRVLETYGGACLMAVRIATGRTHQIRVHLASLGHPVVGDATYGSRRTLKGRDATLVEVLRGFPRPALHAFRLAFDDPQTGRRLAFESPLPEDLQALLTRLHT